MPVLASVLTTASLLLAQPEEEALSRTRALQIALSQNPELAASRAETAKARAQRGQAKAAQWPRIEATLGVGPGLSAHLVPGTAVESTKSVYDVSLQDLSVTIGGNLSAVLPIYTFGKISHRVDGAEHGVEAQLARERITSAEVALAVARLYEGQLYAADEALFLEEVEDRLAHIIEDTRARLRRAKPDVAEQDVLRLESAESLTRLSLHEARAGKLETREGLRAYLGLSSTSSITFKEDGLAPVALPPTSRGELVALALAARPEILALDHGSRAYEELAEAELAGYMPNFFLMAFFSFAYTPNRDLIRTRYVVDPLYYFRPGVLVGLEWSLEGDMAGQRAAEMHAQAEQLAQIRRWATDGVPAEVEKARADAVRADLDRRETEDALVRAKRWVVIAESDYAAGLSDSRSLTDALEAYVVLRSRNIESVFRLNVALAELSKAIGTLGTASVELYPGTGVRTSTGAAHKEGGKEPT
jgi:outer membrane protein TolC